MLLELLGEATALTAELEAAERLAAAPLDVRALLDRESGGGSLPPHGGSLASPHGGSLPSPHGGPLSSPREGSLAAVLAPLLEGDALGGVGARAAAVRGALALATLSAPARGAVRRALAGWPVCPHPCPTPYPTPAPHTTPKLLHPFVASPTPP